MMVHVGDGHTDDGNVEDLFYVIDILLSCILAVGSDMHVGDRCAELIGDEHVDVGYNGSGKCIMFLEFF